MPEPTVDIVIVGGGLAGLSAAIFLARADLKTVVFDAGASTIRPISTVNNYLGFPEGIPGEELLARARKQAERFGATIHQERAEAVTTGDDGTFAVRSPSGELVARVLLIASNKDTAVAKGLGLPLGGRKGRFLTHDGAGRSRVKNVYVCGRITEHPSQAAISVGNGALVALTIIQDLRGEYYVDHDD